MTERTVSVYEEVEETVEVCDECGTADGEMVTLRAVNTPGVDDVHVHMDCLDDMGVDVPDPMTYGEVVDEARHEAAGAAVIAFEWVEITVMVFGGVMLLPLVGWLLGDVGAGAFIPSTLGALAVGAAVYSAVLNAREATEYMRNR